MKLNTLRLALVLSFSVCMLGSTYAQVTLGTSPYTENFDGIGTALPTGWTVRTGATASALGTSQSLTIATTAWNSTTGNFHNSASADSPATATDNTATQDRPHHRPHPARRHYSPGSRELRSPERHLHPVLAGLLQRVPRIRTHLRHLPAVHQHL